MWRNRIGTQSIELRVNLRLIKNMRKSIEFLRGDIAIEFGAEEKLKFKRIHFTARDPANSRVILVIEVDIITILGSKKDTRNEEAMYRTKIHEKLSLVANNPVQINERNNKAFNSTRSIGHNSFNILTDGDAWRSRSMEARNFRGRKNRLVTDEFLKRIGQ